MAPNECLKNGTHTPTICAGYQSTNKVRYSRQDGVTAMNKVASNRMDEYKSEHVVAPSPLHSLLGDPVWIAGVGRWLVTPFTARLVKAFLSLRSCPFPHTKLHESCSYTPNLPVVRFEVHRSSKQSCSTVHAPIPWEFPSILHTLLTRCWRLYRLV